MLTTLSSVCYFHHEIYLFVKTIRIFTLTLQERIQMSRWVCYFPQEREADARLWEARALAGPAPGAAVHGGRLPEHPQPLAGTHDPLQRAQVRLASTANQGEIHVFIYCDLKSNVWPQYFLCPTQHFLVFFCQYVVLSSQIFSSAKCNSFRV